LDRKTKAKENSNMKRVIASLLLLTAMVIGTASAQAQSLYDRVDCSNLTNTPRMCIVNESQYPIVAVQASASMQFGSDWIQIPGSGVIPPQGVGIVQFPTYGTGCEKSVVVKTKSGATHGFPSVNVCKSTKFKIAGW
jgi:hypothetical protein